MSRILIVGATGLIGSAVSELLQNSNVPFLGTSRAPNSLNAKYFDLADSNSEINFLEFSDVIICAGIAGKNVEIDLNQSHKVNVQGTIKLIDSAYKAGCSITFISSSSVFSAAQQGASEDNVPEPATIYGKQKKTIEDYLLSLDHHSTSIRIIRPTKVLSINHGILQSWRTKGQISANSAVSIAPISADFLAKFLLSLLQRQEYGIHHISGEELINYEEFAKIYMQSFQKDRELWQVNFFFDDSNFQDSASILRSVHSNPYSSNTQSLNSLLADISTPSFE